MLNSKLQQVEEGEGHCIFVLGEAGMGKTALLKTFCKEQRGKMPLYQGACDALFTPRPLAPLYDIMWQVSNNLWSDSNSMEERSLLFARFFRELSNRQEKCLIVFEDIHWADEATIDFIKFFARRITQLNCLFVLTYRNDELLGSHPLHQLQGQLAPDTYSTILLKPLSKTAVATLAEEKGFNGDEVFDISGGNPFYVNEILASYSEGVPDNIKNAVLAVYHRTPDNCKQVFDLLSVAPNGFELQYLEAIFPDYAGAIANSVEKRILLIEEGKVFFKHELYRRTIEASLSPLKRIVLNKTILSLLQQQMEHQQQPERIIHHAKNANAYAVITEYAPIAAKQAASLGAHIEASKLYLTAIENYQGNDSSFLTSLYEGYAYECYLSNQVTSAIIFSTKALQLWQASGNIEKTGNALRFLSRLWWLDGNRRKAETFAAEAIQVLEVAPPSSVKSMAFSNMSQLKMLTGDAAACISWGEKAIAIAEQLNDEEILSHALNNVGSVQMRMQSSSQKGIALLQQSLAIALKNGYEEHVARAYNNLGINGVAIKEYAIAKKAFEEGIRYSEDKDLDSFTSYMRAWNAKLTLEQGNWKEAAAMAEAIISKAFQLPAASICAMDVLATIKMRRGDADALPLLQQAKTKAFEAKDLQSIISSVISLLEYEWITGTQVLDNDALQQSVAMVTQMHDFFDYNEFTCWLGRARNHHLSVRALHPGYQLQTVSTAQQAAALWHALGCPYEQAICLFETDEEGKRQAISILHSLGASAVCEKMKLGMRNAGIRKIPRGRRKTTLSNIALLTSRELDLLPLMKEGLQNKEIASRLYISAKTVDHHISSILFKLDVNSRNKAVTEALRQQIIS